MMAALLLITLDEWLFVGLLSLLRLLGVLS